MQRCTLPEHLHFPNESTSYRQARNALLEEEMELRRHIERVAQQRRALPKGGEVPEDYVFEGRRRAADRTHQALGAVRAGKDTLAIYSFMFGPERAEPCSGCTHFLDALDGAALHAAQRINFVVVAKSPLKRLLDLAKQRGWQHLRLLSTAGNTYDRDYFGNSTALSEAMRDQQEFKAGEEWDMPILNVFRREEDGTIRHFWGSELLVRAGRARPGVSPQRPAESAVEHVRRHAGGPRRLRSEGRLLIAAHAGARSSHVERAAGAVEATGSRPARR